MSSPDDPFAALERAAERQASEEKAMKAVVGARAKLVLTNKPAAAFFASLALRLDLSVDWTTPTMATDGRTLFVNPDWCNGLTVDERVGVICHEIMHLVLSHQCRRAGRDAERWNEAADLGVNQIVAQAGFVLPQSRLMPGEGKYAKFPKEKSAEEYYSMLGEPQGGEPDEQGKDGGGGKSSDPGGCGEVRDAKDPADAREQQAKWEVAVAQAEQASKGRGDLPGGLARLVGQVLHPAADWKDILREFVSSQAKNDYSWSHPNRRHIAEGVYLPGMRNLELGEIIIAVDTSGSVGEKELAVFGSEVEAILGAFACSATILYHDCEITKVEEWNSADGPLVLNPVGGGGTDHRPIFEYLERENRSPACVVALTDLETTFPAVAPDVAVLWAVTGGKTTAPFGRVVQVSSSN
ncbi:MAG: hypothetical protein C0467_15995 [Planctomycetaceae bacterium]|nr:hypothetical protein [Planctomycetaceae bacterium]